MRTLLAQEAEAPPADAFADMFDAVLQSAELLVFFIVLPLGLVLLMKAWIERPGDTDEKRRRARSRDKELRARQKRLDKQEQELTKQEKLHTHEQSSADNDTQTTPPVPTVAQIRERFHAVETEYTTSETDPTVLIEAPVLRDVTASSTARFHTAYRRASEMIDTHAVRKKRAQRQPAEPELIDAVTTVEQTWRTAVDTAYRIGLDGLSQVDVRRARAAFNTAFDPAASPAEARAARDRLVGYLDKVTTDATGSHLDGRSVVDNHLAHVALSDSVRLALEAAPDNSQTTGRNPVA